MFIERTADRIFYEDSWQYFLDDVICVSATACAARGFQSIEEREDADLENDRRSSACALIWQLHEDLVALYEPVEPTPPNRITCAEAYSARMMLE